MAERRTDRRRADIRAFRPTLDGRLETKLLMSTSKYSFAAPNTIQTADGGQAVQITNSKGQSFYILASTGTVTANRLPGGRFGLTISGTNQDTVVSINPVIDPRIKGTAHQFNTRLSHYDTLINIGGINVVNGTVNSIVGFRTAILSGPITIAGAARVDRIAFDTIAPGASILTGGDLNTLDVLNSVSLSGTNSGIVVGRDLNSFTVGGNLSIENGSVLSVGRYLGLFAQPAKGTGASGQGAVIQGNLTITQPSFLYIQGFPLAPFVVYGRTTGASRIFAAQAAPNVINPYPFNNLANFYFPGGVTA